MKDKLISKFGNNSLFILIGGVILLVCIVIIIFFTFFYSGSSDVDLEVILNEAVVSYCNDNCDGLFGEGSKVTVTSDTLISGGYMECFEDILDEEDVSCSASVDIYKAYVGYNYITSLDCGNDDSSVLIYDKVVSDSSLVTSGDGLYSYSDSLVYRGEYVNNYFSLGSLLFRIVKVNNDNTLMLVLADYNKKFSYSWDDRYNSDSSASDGINDFSVSRARENLLSIISSDYADSIGTNAILYEYCFGSRSSDSAVNDGSVECSVKSYDYVSLLTVFDFINASLDDNCKSVDNSKGCQNYNYLSVYDNSFWTITPVSGTTNKVFYWSGYDFSDSKAKSKHSLRFVITISGDEAYKDGDGTSSNPYTIYE